MAYSRTYTRINWQDEPSEATALESLNLNKMDSALYELDGRTVDMSGRLDNDETAIGNKVDKEVGKGLSTNDYTTTEKNKLAGIEAGAQVNTVTGVKGNSEGSYRTGNVNITKANIGLGNVDNTSDANKPVSTATQTALDGKVDKVTGKGLSTNDYTTAEKNKLAGIEAQANKTIVDSTISTSSTNPVQNKIITEALREIMPEVTVTGNPISISDGSNIVPAKLAEVTFLPKQDLHGYDSPWVGGAGKNKFDTPTATSTGASNIFNKKSVNLPSGTYTLSFTSASTITTTMSITFYNGTTSIITGSVTAGNTSVTVTLSSDCDNLTWYVREAVSLSNIQIEAGNQKTTFAPYSNICPISGWTELNLNRCGKNIVNEIHHGSISSSGTYGTGNTRATNATSETSSVIKVKAGKYTISAVGLDYATILTKDNYNNIVDNFAGSWHALPYTFTITQTANLYFTARKSDNTSITLSDVSVQIEEGETATTYEAYQGQTYTEPLGSTYYGGKVDFVSGEGQNTYREIDENSFSSVTSSASSGGLHWTDVVIGYAPSDIVCDRLVRKDGNSGWSSTTPCISYVESGGSKLIRIYCEESSISDFQTAYSGLQIVFTRETSQELTLTPQEIELLKGQNVLTTDGDNIKLVYSADIKAWVESQLSNS